MNQSARCVFVDSVVFTEDPRINVFDLGFVRGFNFADITEQPNGAPNLFSVENGDITLLRFFARTFITGTRLNVDLDLNAILTDPTDNLQYRQSFVPEGQSVSFNSQSDTVISNVDNLTITPIEIPFETSDLPAILVIGGVVVIAHFKGKGEFRAKGTD